jgi:nanoRNase/pAp phosphatase (c-di-AMP/oligoRNAs hydrolase)
VKKIILYFFLYFKILNTEYNKYNLRNNYFSIKFSQINFKYKNMIDISVVGHKVPDTDCVLSAIIAADYLSKKGYNPSIYMQGELNKETEFLLNQLNINKPEIKTSFEAGTRMCLVDHNEDFQAPDNI